MKVACFAILLLIAFGHANAALGNDHDHEHLSSRLTGLFKGIHGFLAKVRGIRAIDRREAVGGVHEIDTHKMKVHLGTKGHMFANKLSNEMRKVKCSKKCGKTLAKPCVVKCRKCPPHC